MDELKPLLGCKAGTSKQHSHKKELATKITGKPLCTNNACALCDTYGHYTHHCLEIPWYRDALHAIERSYQEDPSIQSINDEPRTILYLQEEHRYVERPPVIPIICCTLCGEGGHNLEECATWEIIHRWYPIERIYYVGLRAAQFTCPLCTDNHLLEDCHYIPCF